MTPIETLGFAGMVLIVVAWATGLSGDPPPVKLASVYSMGSLLLTIYSIHLGDPIFIVLNGAALLFSLVSLVRGYLHRERNFLGRC